MKKSDLVSKTVRMPAELIEFVEFQRGKNFTEKLVNLLEDIHSGTDKRLATVKHLDELIEEDRRKLLEYGQRYLDAAEIYRKAGTYLKEIAELPEDRPP